MNYRKFFMYLGKENGFDPQHILRVMEEAESEGVEESTDEELVGAGEEISFEEVGEGAKKPDDSIFQVAEAEEEVSEDELRIADEILSSLDEPPPDIEELKRRFEGGGGETVVAGPPVVEESQGGEVIVATPPPPPSAPSEVGGLSDVEPAPSEPQTVSPTLPESLSEEQISPVEGEGETVEDEGLAELLGTMSQVEPEEESALSSIAGKRELEELTESQKEQEIPVSEFIPEMPDMSEETPPPPPSTPTASEGEVEEDLLAGLGEVAEAGGEGIKAEEASEEGLEDLLSAFAPEEPVAPSTPETSEVASQGEEDFNIPVEEETGEEEMASLLGEFPEMEQEIKGEEQEIGFGGEETGEEVSFEEFGELGEESGETEVSFGEMEEKEEVQPFEFSPLGEETEAGGEAGEEVEEIAEFEEIAPPELEEEKEAPVLADENVELVRQRINELPQDLRKFIRRVIIEERLPRDEMRILMGMLLSRQPPETLEQFLEEALGEKPKPTVKPVEELEPVQPVVERRVIKSETAVSSKEILQKYGKLATAFGFAGILVLVLGFLLARTVWKKERAKYYYELGLKAINAGVYDKAEQYFLKGMTYSGPDVDWFNEFGLAYMKKKKYDLALKKFKTALKIDYTNPAVNLNLAKLYLSLSPPRFSSAIERYEVLRRTNPDDFSIVDKIGQTYIRWGDETKDPTKYNLAEFTYSEFLSKHENHLDSMFRLLQVALRQGDHKKVDRIYDAIDSIDEKAVSVKIFTELIKFYLDKGEYDKAKKVINKTLNANPDYPYFHYQYARYLFEMRDFVRAEELLKQLVNVKPKSGKDRKLIGSSFNLLGKIYFAENRIVDAAEMFKNAVRFNPDLYEPYAYLGHINYDAYDYYHALLNYERALKKKPPGVRDDELYYNLGWIYYKNGDNDSALNTWFQIYSQNPEDPVLSYALGNTYLKMKRYRLAFVEYTKAIDRFEKIYNGFGYINPNVIRQRKVITLLARSYNNLGVTYLMESIRRRNPDLEEKALLYFWKAIDIADRIGVNYAPARVNITYITHLKTRRYKKPLMDDVVPRKKSLFEE